MSAALKEAGIHRPALVLDRDRLDGNIAAVRRKLHEGLALRIVDKSLPCIPLMRRVAGTFSADRIMSFHLPVTRVMLQAFPEADFLYGKPLPVAALRHEFNSARPEIGEMLAKRVVWLIDTEERLEHYAALATERGITLRFAFEVDTGMHRGGIADAEALKSLFDVSRRSPQLECEGIMGYEAHIPEIPGLFGGAEGEHEKVAERLHAFAAALPPECRRIVNTGGSKTSVTYRPDGMINEVSMGSGFVKPTDFDVKALAELKPAIFIATPVLKIVEARLPGPLLVTRFLQALGMFPRKGCFLYSGKWYARPAWPEGMKENDIWGLSSNQQLMGLPSGCDLKVDDVAFFRPTQSEAVLQQFGAIAVYSGGRIVENWDVLPTG
ncbi:alanine racemase [Pseudohoeflea suaedae]|uniref:alanine racemase n=1 Tax=Pseudohoeflea suaedae TaxID=877384 RepID=UPI001FCE374A|nr:alanine racemase [Pseudohoeflea suaedae]